MSATEERAVGFPFDRIDELEKRRITPQEETANQDLTVDGLFDLNETIG